MVLVGLLILLPLPRLGLGLAAPLALVGMAVTALALLAFQPALRSLIEASLEGHTKPAA